MNVRRLLQLIKTREHQPVQIIYRHSMLFYYRGRSFVIFLRISLDPARRTVLRGEKKIDLSPKEFSLLDYFMRNPGRVLTRTMITEHVWDYDFDTETNVIDVYVNYLRKKIDTDRELKLIHTVRGVGYVLRES